MLKNDSIKFDNIISITVDNANENKALNNINPNIYSLGCICHLEEKNYLDI